MKKFILLFLIFIFLILGVVWVWKKLNYDNDVIKESIPSAQVYNSSAVLPVPTKPPISTPQLLIEVNLAIPFTVQAPHANWEDPYGDFCEEASVLMAASYIKGWDIPNANFADSKMFEIKTFEEKRFGYYKDTTAEETATILKEFYKIEKIKVVYDPTVEDIKKALSEKKVVIIPAAGRQLGNPYFHQPGPLYHMLVIKGYTKEGNFITNDPGTRRGADFIYSSDVLMNAIHDWNFGDVESGRKVAIIVG